MRSVARCALIRCRRFRSASLWLRTAAPFRVVAVAGAEHSPSASVAIPSIFLKVKASTGNPTDGKGKRRGAGRGY